MDKPESVSAMDDCCCPEPWTEHCGCVGRRRCVRRTGRGKGPRCSKAPVDGTTVCASHGAGKGSPVRAQADKAVEVARLERVARTFGTPVEVGVLEGLVTEWHRANGIVAWLADQVAELDPSQLTSLTKVDGQQEHALVTMLREERKHLSSLGIQLARLGIEEQQLRLAEGKGLEIVRVLGAIIGSPLLGLTEDQRRVAAVLVKEQLPALLSGS